MRQSYVEAGLLGERFMFAIKGRPDPSRAILLTGSGRSGTTWITDILASSPGIQLIFEPLFPMWSREVEDLTGWHETDQEVHSSHIRSYYLRATGNYPGWERYLPRVLEGKIRNYWTDYRRDAFFPSRFLFKFVRANLMLGNIYENFKPKIVYTIRHPCAVVASRMAISWHVDVAGYLGSRSTG